MYVFNPPLVVGVPDISDQSEFNINFKLKIFKKFIKINVNEIENT